MRLMSRLHRWLSLKAFKDERGVSAIEFALIAPVLLVTYLGLSELTLGMMASRRASHLAATIGDLAAQSDTLTGANMTDLYEIGTSMLDPFATGTALKIRVSSVTMQSTGSATVDWSDGKNYTAYTAGTVISGITTTQLATGESLIMTEVQYNFTPPFGEFLPIGTTFTDKFYHRPRNGTKVTKTA